MASIDIESEVLQSLGQIRFAICGLLKIANLQTYKAKIWYRRYVTPPSEDESSVDDDENSTTDSEENDADEQNIIEQNEEKISEKDEVDQNNAEEMDANDEIIDFREQNIENEEENISESSDKGNFFTYTKLQFSNYIVHTYIQSTFYHDLC